MSARSSQKLAQLAKSSNASLTQLPRRLRVEANFLKFPFFLLTRQAKESSQRVLEFRLERTSDQEYQEEEFYWKVTGGADTSLPGEFARRIHREVVERKLSELPRPVNNPICLGSFRDICRTLEITLSGKNIKFIRASLLSIKKAEVQARGTFYSKSKKGYIDDYFNLYDRVVFTGARLPNDQIADAVYVYLGSWYLENLNANYVVPLDFEYFRKLRGPLSSRMYELLHHWFFISLRMQQPTVQRRYSTLCQYFPLTRQTILWRAKQQLREAHRQHHQNGYLTCLPDWRSIPGTKTDWTIVYTAGPKATDEYRRNQSRRDQEGFSPDELPSGAQPLLLPSPSGLSELQQDLIRELEIHGVTHGIAFALVSDHAPPLIQQKIETFQWLMAKSDRTILTNPAGYLRTSIEQNYAPPEGFVPAAERQRQAADEAARRRAAQDVEAQADRDRQQRATAIEARWIALSPADRASIEVRAEGSLTPFATQSLARERLEARQNGTGHFALRAEIEKLLAAELDD